MVWGIGEFKNNRDDVGYVECRDEKHLIQEFLSFWEKNQPDVITGWNTEFFDIPYLHNRIVKLYDDKEVKRLSPWRNVYSKEVYMMGRNHQVIDIQGVSALDYFDLYRKFTYSKQEKYTLDYIAYVELGERKEGNPYETFSEWYLKDYQSFIEYNITDVELVDRLEDKMKLIELALTMAYDLKQIIWTFLEQQSIGILLFTTISERKTLLFHKELVHQRLKSLRVLMSKTLLWVCISG